MSTRWGALDGLRGLALAGVLVYHSLPGLMPGGFLGVEVFFVLSGFLLASILLKEHDRHGSVGWRRYVARRVRRLLPAMLALLGSLVLIVPFVAAEDAHRLAGDVYSSLTGVTNWHLIQDHSSYFGELGRPPLVRHLWSLAIEIQFYVVCPIIVAVLARRPRALALRVLGGGIAVSAMLMALLYVAGDPSRAYFGTDTRVGALLSGVLLAFVLQRANWSDRYVAPAGALGLLYLGTLFLVTAEQSRLLYPLGFLATQLATAAVITAALRPGTISGALAARPLQWLGVRSYGAYLWHWPLVALLRPRVDVGWSPGFAAVVTIGGALVLGHLSYALIERPFLTGGAVLPRPATVMRALQWSLGGIAATGMAVLIGHLPDTDPIVSSLRAGQQVVSLQSDAPAAASAPAPAPEAAPEAAPVPPPPAPVASAIGDSVMLGAAPSLQARLNGGPIDAKVSRQFADGIAVAKALAAQGRLGQVVIVHLGTNGPPRPAEVDALMAQLAGVPRVLLVTARMPRRWEGATNDILRAAVGRHPTAVLVDWHAHSNGHAEWFMSDGVHLRPVGQQAFADLIAAALVPPAPPPTTTAGDAPPSRQARRWGRLAHP